ncbi:MAG: single-stranded DNA-binding protein [Gemmatimonadota bacterium]|nr:single-stranded DNA-binding protein [Gemmatimonadota bacterium]
MSRTMNRVELLGRVGTEPDLKYSQNGTAVTTLRMATDRRRQNGETEADWHSVVCWGKLAEAVSEYVQKGNRVFVAGSLAQNSYEREDGERVYRTEVHAQEILFLDSNGNGGNGSSNGNGSREAAEAEAETAAVF